MGEEGRICGTTEEQFEATSFCSFVYRLAVEIPIKMFCKENLLTEDDADCLVCDEKFSIE